VLDRGAPRTDEGELLRELARRNVIRHNPKRASYYVKNSGRIFDWILSVADKEWVAKNCHAMCCPPPSTVIREVSGWKFYYGTVAFECHNEPFNKSWSGLLMMNHEKAVADGAKWFFQHHAEICDVDGSGAVTGVVAKRADGKYIRFKARKGVALCAGGFASNLEMVIDILDTVRHEAEARGVDLDLLVKNASRGRGGEMMGGGMGYARDGSSIKLGIWAGGHIEIGPRATMGAGDPATGPWFLQLNRNGERFCDEAAGTPLPHPDCTALVTLYDANWKKILYMMPPRHGAPDTADAGEMSKRLVALDHIKPGPPSKDQQPLAGGYYGLPGVSGTTCCANTIEELFDYMDCYKGEALKKALAEIKRYNEMCEKGVDEDFGKDPRIMKVTALKDPPFYGSVSGGGLGAGGMGGPGSGINGGMVTTTGLDTDADGRVLNSDFEPIKGLYAAGNNAGGRYIVVYQSPLAGISLGMAITEGYMLGEMLADM
jgi:hypothetical protein